MQTRGEGKGEEGAKVLSAQRPESARLKPRRSCRAWPGARAPEFGLVRVQGARRARRGEGGQEPGNGAAVLPKSVEARASPAMARSGVSTAGAAEHAPSSPPAARVPSCPCMSLSFPRGCSLSFLGSFRLLRRLRVQTCVCPHRPCAGAPGRAARARQPRGGREIAQRAAP